MSITIAGNLKSTAEIQYNGIYNRWFHFDDYKFQSHLNFEKDEVYENFRISFMIKISKISDIPQ